MKTNTTKGLAVALSAALVLSVTVVPADAKAKKPSVSTTKVSIKVGATKKVTVKNATKVTWTIDKAGKKVVSLSKTSKKGATIKGKKAGSAKVTAAMKYGKKTLKKTIKVTVKGGTAPVATPTPVVTPEPTATPVPMVTPEPTTPPAEGFKRIEADLANAEAPEDGTLEYNQDTKVLHVTDTPLFIYQLPEMLPMDSTVEVTVKGKMNGELGFRSYLLTDAEDIAVSNIANSDEDGIIGEFEWKFTLTNEIADASYIQFKGISHGTNIDDIEISSIMIDYKPAK